jgi:alpha-D-ribose 1-methylphosphonate 5-triphosphate synthase subunit PhnG
MDTYEVICECAIENLVQLISQMEASIAIEIVIAPKLGMTMIQAEDSIDFQPFYLGEVLITECQLTVDGQLGYGYCMGDAGQRAYCIAIIDAILHTNDHPMQKDINEFITIEKQILYQKKLEEYNQILKTKVDFKIMEQD